LRLEADRLDHERRRVDRDLTLTVMQAFIEVLRAQRECASQRQSVEQLETYLGLVRQLIGGGKANYTDVLKTEIQLNRSALALRRADGSLVAARYALSAVTGTELDSSVSILGSLDSVSTTRTDSIPIDQAANLDLAVADLGVRRALLDVEVIHREQWPSISLFGDAGYLSSMENLRLPSTDRVGALGFSVGITVELPLLNWGATGLRAERRQLEAEALRHQGELQRRSILTDLRTTQRDLANARSQLQVLRANITKAEENFLLTRSIFAGGATLSLEVLTAQQLLIETELAELETLALIQLLTVKLDYHATHYRCPVCHDSRSSSCVPHSCPAAIRSKLTRGPRPRYRQLSPLRVRQPSEAPWVSWCRQRERSTP
jgi:outer membrane protein TolC